MAANDPSDLDDDLLVQTVAAHGRLLWDAVLKQHHVTYGTESDDPRWPYPVPLRHEIQELHFMSGALDATDVAFGTLARRPSQQAFGAIRFLVETLVTVRWLRSAPDETELIKRSRRLVYGSLTRMVKIAKDAPPEAEDADETLENVTAMRDALVELTKEEGIGPIGEPPARRKLFTDHLDIGYGFFSMLSEFGGHPGPLGILLFSRDGVNRVINVNLAGALIERAYWIAIAYETFAHICELLGGARGWDEWLETTMSPLISNASPYLEEAGVRWEASARAKAEAESIDR